MNKERIWALIILVIACALGYFVYSNITQSSRFNFKYGLDLSGGTHLVYEADTSKLSSGDVESAMDALKNVIEKRVNLFGVSEPLVQIEDSGVFGLGEGKRLVVELPGVTDVEKAIDMIGKTPLLEFKLVPEDLTLPADGTMPEDVGFIETGLSGRFLTSATLGFDSTLANEPYVSIVFNEEGRELFKKITKENIGRELAIFLDGEILSAPVIREEIDGGQAQITGGFTPNEAKTLTRDLNLGALPVPIILVGTDNVGATLGQKVLDQGVKAGVMGILLVMIFMTFYYRLPGLVSSLSLAIYLVLMFFIFQLMSVTITAAGIAGLVLSVGMAVDANVLIFERMKDELKKGESFRESAEHGFKRAWLSIRDGNTSTLISAGILFWLGTAQVEGFALILFIGVIVSMFTAITLTRTFLLSVLPSEKNKLTNFLFKAN
ncbi:MAG: protein translocase subunit SecD [Patescibacteria group bacterium]